MRSTSYQHLWYRRTRRLDVPLITELQILPKDTEPKDMSQHWHKVPNSLHEGIIRAEPLFLWYRAEKTRRELDEEEFRDKLITELDILYGEDISWYGFEKLQPTLSEELAGRRDATFITYRTGIKRAPMLA